MHNDHIEFTLYNRHYFRIILKPPDSGHMTRKPK